MKGSFAATVLLVAALAVGASPRPALAGTDLQGTVVSPGGAVEGALVVAWDLARQVSSTVLAGPDGAFRFPSLPSGVYRILATKPGFLPAAVRRFHAGAGDPPLELSLRPRADRSATSGAPSGATPEEVWRIRAATPPDLLRELETLVPAEETAAAAPSLPEAMVGPVPTAFRGSVSAMAGVSQGASGDTAGDPVARTRIGLAGELPGGGRWSLGAGWRARQQAELPNLSDTDVELAVEPAERQRILWKSRRTDLLGDGPVAPATGSADRFDAHSVTWEAEGSSGSRAELSARLVEESLVAAGGTPSRLGRLLELGAGLSSSSAGRSGFSAGVRVRQEESEVPGRPLDGGQAAFEPARTVDLDAGGRTRLSSRWLFEYGAVGSLAASGQIDGGPRAALAWQSDRIGRLRAGATWRLASETAAPLTSGIPLTLGEDETLDRSESRSVELGWSLAGATRGEGLPGASLAVDLRWRSLDRPARLFLSNGLGGSFDELVLPAGTTLREIRVAGGRPLGPITADLLVVAREADLGADGTVTFGEATLTGIVVATGTELRLGRAFRVSGGTSDGQRLDRTDLVLGQRLPFPRAWRASVKLLLLGELAEGTLDRNSLEGDSPTTDRRWMGGVAFEF